MMTYFDAIVNAFDCFSQTLNILAPTLEQFVIRYHHTKIAQKPYCKNGKHMRRRNYWKAVSMDRQIASQHKHVL